MARDRKFAAKNALPFADVSAEDLAGFHKAGCFFYKEGCLSEAQKLRLLELASIYTDELVTRLLLPIVTQDYPVSLRLVDWFVTNYTKRHRLLVSREGADGARQLVNVYDIYKDYLKVWRRKLFDPFRRKARVYFLKPGRHDVVLETTCAQLNFLIWADTYGVLAQVIRYREDVEKDMLTRIGEAKDKRQAAGDDSHARHRRCELTPACSVKCQVYYIEQVISFDQAGRASAPR